jgi:redox-sensitive bicupin YhaK (pirin superfamily)
MSAGAGIRHAEYDLAQEPTQLCQIWITPNVRAGRDYNPLMMASSAMRQPCASTGSSRSSSVR